MENWARGFTLTEAQDKMTRYLDLFITLLERVLDKTRERLEGVVISGTRINNMCFADDIDLIDENEQRLEQTVQELNDEGKKTWS